MAVKLAVPSSDTVAEGGVAVMVLTCCCTTTVTWLAAVRPSWSAIVTRKVYVPACVKVAVLVLAALVPLAPNVAPVGPEVTAQV